MIKNSKRKIVIVFRLGDCAEIQFTVTLQKKFEMIYSINQIIFVYFFFNFLPISRKSFIAIKG